HSYEVISLPGMLMAAVAKPLGEYRRLVAESFVLDAVQLNAAAGEDASLRGHGGRRGREWCPSSPASKSPVGRQLGVSRSWGAGTGTRRARRAASQSFSSCPFSA
ncbi:MAG: hypothetical protein ABI822_25850, partial [Bryobacteraceae bacterium]